MTVRILVGDCREVMAGMESDSVDAIVTDPPYGLEFMGKEWDRFSDAGFKIGNGYSGRQTPSWHSGTWQNKRCRLCGHIASGGSPCRCDNPEWDIEVGRSTARSLSFQSWSESWAREAYRVLRPGGHMLAFGGTRTHHRLMVAIEDAGFEIRDTLMWVYASGFPKSHDISKAIDKAAGAEREVVGARRAGITPGGNLCNHGVTEDEKMRPITAPATDAARQWEGWGSALKPSVEPIVLARKTLSEKNLAANVLAHGTGGLNIDATRIGTDDFLGRPQTDQHFFSGLANNGFNDNSTGKGRWPANLILSCACPGDAHEPECPCAMLDAQSGERPSRAGQTKGRMNSGCIAGIADSGPRPKAGTDYDRGYGNDSGGASRFFFCAKSSRSERNKGLEGMPEREGGAYANGAGMPGRTLINGEWQQTGTWQEPNRIPRENFHPTVKPLSLMQWLVKLITPLGGTVLDCFGGSGSTMVAADREGFHGIYIDSDEEYAEIARKRVYGDAPLFAKVAD